MNSIYGDISNSMDEIIAKYQQINGINNGDIAPDLYNRYCDCINDMALIVELILKNQRG